MKKKKKTKTTTITETSTANVKLLLTNVTGIFSGNNKQKLGAESKTARQAATFARDLKSSDCQRH